MGIQEIQGVPEHWMGHVISTILNSPLLKVDWSRTIVLTTTMCVNVFIGFTMAMQIKRKFIFWFFV